MKAAFVAVVAATTLAACSQGMLDSDAIAYARPAAARQLKDSESARFSGEYVIRNTPDQEGTQTFFVCGRVDGKNGFGAYTGGSRYVASFGYLAKGDTVLPFYVSIESPEEMVTTAETLHKLQKESIFEVTVWNKHCVDPAHPATYTGLPGA